ncbi:MAG: EAL domain-containing protein, partial [Rhodocyclaceae bacterium]|nr:EAL domain-containing protein [Rhodocyclaceae bacterium]
CPEDDPDADTLLRHADQAMYRAKEQGKNCYHLYDPEQDRQVKAHRHRLQRLSAALAGGEFVLHYQPKVDLVDRRVFGAEGLVRWRHPEEGLLLPVAFLQDVNGTDLEVALGEWVIDTALAQVAAWQQEGLDLTVSVNISANHLLRADFADRLRQGLDRHRDVAPDRLELEILETAALNDLERATRTLANCRQLGVRFALDDFGTGYASLAYFRKLPVDVLKIDQSFVRNMLDDPTDLDIVESVVRLAEAFNRPVIAEGVETAEHGALLVLIGCRLAQGWGIARAMPAESMGGWIQSWCNEAAGMTFDDRPGRRENLPLLVAAQSHRNWIRAFEDRIGAPDSHPMSEDMDSRHCRFGRWYLGSGATRYGTLPEFRAIAPFHERVHAQAAEMAELLRDGHVEEARARLPDLHRDRDELLRAIDALVGRVMAPPESPPSLPL